MDGVNHRLDATGRAKSLAQFIADCPGVDPIRLNWAFVGLRAAIGKALREGVSPAAIANMVQVWAGEFADPSANVPRETDATRRNGVTP